MEGLSSRALLLNEAMEFVILLYLFEEDASWLVKVTSVFVRARAFLGHCARRAACRVCLLSLDRLGVTDAHSGHIQDIQIAASEEAGPGQVRWDVADRRDRSLGLQIRLATLSSARCRLLWLQLIHRLP